MGGPPRRTQGFREAVYSAQQSHGSQQLGGRLNHSLQMHFPHCEPHQVSPHGQHVWQVPQPAWLASKIAINANDDLRSDITLPLNESGDMPGSRRPPEHVPIQRYRPDNR
jgi:phage tail protein X